jgi:hypothetical protein
VKGFPKSFEAIRCENSGMQIFLSDYLLVCEYLQANICLYVNICMGIFT